MSMTVTNLITDHSTLLEFKHNILDPHSFLDSNWSTNTSICYWIGVSCDARHGRVAVLDLSHMDLHGTIAPHLGNLSFLVSLTSSGNNFHGYLPKELAKLHRLELLDLSRNAFSGEIPSWFGNLTTLKALYLGGNNFQETFAAQNMSLITGPIPSSIFNISSLKEIYLYNNSLSGSISNEMCHQLRKLEVLYLYQNELSGHIPSNIGECNNLQILSLMEDRLSGTIPRSIGTLMRLKHIYLNYNDLDGEIPLEIGNLIKLEIIDASHMRIGGHIPHSIFNISSVKMINFQNNSLSVEIFLTLSLTLLSLNLNSFSGFISNTLGNLTFLEVLRLWSNQLTTKNPTQEWTFLSSLKNCKNQRVLELSSNPLNGILPSSISNLSASLEEFGANDCKIKGIIPVEIGNLSNIMSLDLSQNELSGSIPATIGRLRNVQGLIPMCLGDLISLRYLYLDFNKLHSTIPFSFWSLKDILGVDSSSNYLNGSLSLGIGNLKALTYLNLSSNLLSSDIPIAIGGLKGLQILSLSSNILQGPIPESLGDLTSLETLDLSNNNLSGIIPKSLERLSYLRYFNVAFNKLEGKIPTEGSFQNFTAKSFMNNYALCGPPRLQVPPYKSSTHRLSKVKLTYVLRYVLPIIASIIVTVTFIIIFKKCQNSSTNVSVNEGLTLKIRSKNLYKRLLQATDGFSEGNLFGSMYKGILSDGKNVAVKVFNLQLEGAFKSFDVESEVMQNILQRKLVKVISCCSCVDFKALMLEFMPNGSLEKWLYSHYHFLDILQRINIMIDVASTLEYLHLGYPNPIIHCDLKPSNILLDKDMVAHVGDFGIAKLLGEAEFVKQTMTFATIGYMAPEYGSTGIVSVKSDIYSYDILLMETFTRMKPTNEIFIGDMSMKQWVKESLSNNNIIDVVDSNLLQIGGEYVMATTNCLSFIMRLALDCTIELSGEHKDMKDVVSTLQKIKIKLLNNVKQA
ncbi:hypothetical protein CRYUN_Cryun23aG0007800 [Craigia yunnanensis]